MANKQMKTLTLPTKNGSVTYDITPEWDNILNKPDLAEESLIGSTDEITPSQVVEALAAGRPMSITHTDPTFGDITFNSFVHGQAFNSVMSTGIAYYFGHYLAVEIAGNTIDDTWDMVTATIATTEDVPTDNHINSLIDEKLEDYAPVQADLSQNDPLQPNYVKNRTHWVEEGDEMFINGMWVAERSMFEFGAPLGLKLGKTYIVTWDGIKYECVAHEVDFDGIPAVGLGNTPLMLETDDNGYPFVIGEIPEEAAAAMDGLYGLLMSTDFTINHEFSINRGIVHKLDPKFYERVAWVEGGVENLPETTFELIDSMDLLGASIYTPLQLVAGETYIVTINGEEYTCTASKIENINGIILMDGSSLESFNTFVIIELYEPLQDSVTGETIYAFIQFNELSDTTQQFTLRIYQQENIHKLDPKFLPDNVALKSDIEAYVNEAILGGAW